jgi:CDP-paratose 2-epimerase
VSLAELTAMCRERAGRGLAIGREPETHPTDVPYYVTDNTHIAAVSGWTPRRSVEAIVDDIFAWLRRERTALEPILGAPTQAVATP